MHSSFFYPNQGGSQLIADTLAKSIDVRYNTQIEQIERRGHTWIVNDEQADAIVFCGNIKHLPQMLAHSINLEGYKDAIDQLPSHGTTSVFCEIQENPYSWIYLPSKKYDSHRIICTGNFSPNNNREGKMTATIEFTDYISIDDILEQLKQIPYHPVYLTHHYAEYTYPIQTANTRKLIVALKERLQPQSFYLCGRFAEWEYFNMDAAMGSALDLGIILKK